MREPVARRAPSRGAEGSDMGVLRGLGALVGGLVIGVFGLLKGLIVGLVGLLRRLL